MSVQLLQGDCLDLLPTLPAQSVDLVLSDWPYGTTACAWDSVIPLDKLWPAIRRVLQPRGAVVLTASQPFTSVLVLSNIDWFRYEWIWEKSRASNFLDANRKPLKIHESVLVFSPVLPAYNPQKWQIPERFMDRRKVFNLSSDTREMYHKFQAVPHKKDDGSRLPVSVLCFPNEVGLHPTQKPLALMEYLIRTYSNPGDVVLDNTMGSGTTGHACVTTGRAFIGIEQDAAYFAIACARIAAAQAAPVQPPLPERIPA